tara:strand:- start:1012 stop:1830 length:819 start_codon:yes stop_codon:yes gene_type:complete
MKYLLINLKFDFFLFFEILLYYIMQCPKCNKNNLIDSNFCSRCGYDISKIQIRKCSICLEECNKQEILICGHTFCKNCIDTQYNIKKECPMCRKKIRKCTNCNSYRVNKEKKIYKCLNCFSEVHKLNNTSENKILCIDCNSKRVIYNHLCNYHSCLDCFRNFKIQGSEVRTNNNNNNCTTICLHCFSNRIKLNDDFTYNCLNCKSEDIKTKNISLLEYSSLTLKTKEEVNPDIKKCSVCLQNKIFECTKPNGFEKSYYCYICNKQDVKIIYS